jgi:hypothetical protein
LCPDKQLLKDLKFVGGGDSKARIRDSTRLMIKACTGDDCDDDEIYELLSKINVELIFMNANFDPKSFSSPINFFFDYQLNQ